MEPGHALTSWTIRLALVAYVVTVILGFPATWGKSRNPWRFRVSRVVWLVGAVCLAAHVGVAFHYYHDWSHRRAYEDTAKQTDELLGWAFGGGIFFSYLFALVWLLDALWWSVWPISFARRPRVLHTAIHAYLAFIAFNGAIVFESGAVRWIGLGVIPVLMLIVYRRYRASRASSIPLPRRSPE